METMTTAKDGSRGRNVRIRFVQPNSAWLYRAWNETQLFDSRECIFLFVIYSNYICMMDIKEKWGEEERRDMKENAKDMNVSEQVD